MSEQVPNIVHFKELNANDKNFRKLLLLAHNKKCFYTGVKLNINDFDVDHIVPVAFGGKSVINNLVPCASSLNRRKSKKHIDLYSQKLVQLNELMFVPKLLKLINKNSVDVIKVKLFSKNKINEAINKSGYYDLIVMLIHTRKQRGYSQSHMANLLGIDRRKIISFEGLKKIDLETLLNYSHKLSVEIKLNHTIH